MQKLTLAWKNRGIGNASSPRDSTFDTDRRTILRCSKFSYGRLASGRERRGRFIRERSRPKPAEACPHSRAGNGHGPGLQVAPRLSPGGKSRPPEPRAACVRGAIPDRRPQPCRRQHPSRPPHLPWKQRASPSPAPSACRQCRRSPKHLHLPLPNPAMQEPRRPRAVGTFLAPFGPAVAAVGCTPQGLVLFGAGMWPNKPFLSGQLLAWKVFL